MVAGHPANHTELESGVSDEDATTVWKLADLNGWNYRNFGIGSQTSADILARISQVTFFEPTYCLLTVGINDIALSVPVATYISNMTSILDTLTTAGIIPIVTSIYPSSDAYGADRDTFNGQLETLVGGYATAIYVDCEETLGQYSAAGPANNHWNLKTEYNSGDSVHMNADGYHAAAVLINSQL